MYNYSKIAPDGRTNYAYPSDDMLINGNSLSDLIDGYRQLHVAGRGVVGMKPHLTEVPGRAGAFFNYTQDDIRELKITFKLEAKSSDELRDKYERLNAILRGVNADGYLPIKFADEPSWSYFGVLSDAKDAPEQGLQVIDEFEILCPNPYKKHDVQSSKGKVELYHAKEVNPLTIEGEVLTTVSAIGFKVGTKQIVFMGSYKVGQKVKFEWTTEEFKAIVAGSSIMHELANFHIPETFTVKHDDVVEPIGFRLDKVTWQDERL
ncbi:distal tail protein Dit [Ignavigranum ruoffiae]|uniref:distal tail protein Dit n=1 Tax=Ignavigranum ruoffiae TaxID=89093 RepID=UPI003B00D165